MAERLGQGLRSAKAPPRQVRAALQTELGVWVALGGVRQQLDESINPRRDS